MAIKSVYPREASDEKVEMSMDEFKRWLKKFDTDRDGQITVKELREAIRGNGGWFSTWKAKRGVKYADKNCNGVIDENEIINLVEFAQKQLGFRFVS